MKLAVLLNLEHLLYISNLIIVKFPVMKKLNETAGLRCPPLLVNIEKNQLSNQTTKILPDILPTVMIAKVKP